jgi:hypothetical protein
MITTSLAWQILPDQIPGPLCDPPSQYLVWVFGYPDDCGILDRRSRARCAGIVLKGSSVLLFATGEGQTNPAA